MVRLLALGLLVVFVAWGVSAGAGRPFTWAMFSGSSKPFLWTCEDGSPRIATLDELRLAPDNHYLLPADVPVLAAEPGAAVPIRGAIVGTRGGYRVDAGGGGEVTCVPLEPGEDLSLLVGLLRHPPGCPPRP